MGGDGAHHREPGHLCAEALRRGHRGNALTALLLLVALLVGMAGAARAQATEPVFDTAYDTRLGNILRGTLSTSSADYAALEAEAVKSKAGDRTASRVLAQLQRVRAEIGNAAPLRRISLVGFGARTYAFYNSANTYVQALGNARGTGSSWYWSGHIAGSHICALSTTLAPGEDFHDLRGPYGCFMEAETNYNDTPQIVAARGTYLGGAGGYGITFDGGCTHLVAAWTYAYSDCAAAWYPDHLFWDRFHPVSNMQPYTNQSYDVMVGYWWWEPIWNPSAAPTDQATSLTDGRAKIDDADNGILRAWLNHLFDPANYRAPLPVGQTMGTCARGDDGFNIIDANPCEQVIR